MHKSNSIIYIFFFVLITIFSSTIIFAEESPSPKPQDVKQEYESVKEEIDKLQRQLNNTQNQERTLGNQIIQFDSQIRLTTLQITEIREQIEQLETEITVLQSQIDGLEITLEKISSVMADRAVKTYQRGSLTPLKLLVAADGFDTFVTKYAYISYLQTYNKQLLLELQKNQNNIADKKKELEDKKQLIDKKRKQLESLKSTLDGQKVAKQALLEATQNDEARYKKLLEAAQAKEQALAQLIFKDGKVSYKLGIYGLSKQGSVSQGTRIGTMGNSGYPRCTTAAHLHFETIQNATVTDSAIVGDLVSPLAYLKSRSISTFQDDNSISSENLGAGSWEWPLSNPVVTQKFGKTPWSSRYLSGFHTGFDMVDYADKTVRAPAGGTLYYAKIACGSAINIAIIDHGHGVLSDYLHLQ